MGEQKSDLTRILEIGIALSKETDRNRLLDRILTESMELTNCDAGTLYIYREGELHFKLMKTLSLQYDRGKDGEKIDLPPVAMNPENICAYCVLHKTPVNISDVYKSRKFNFAGPREYDRLTGYHTQSMLAIPLIDQENVVGVLQLINAMDETGEIQAFDFRMEHIVTALASQAAVTISNIRYMREIKEQMWSFTEAMAEAIDTRTPYNANHVRMVADYVGRMADYINLLHERGQEKEYFSKERREKLILSALLHDIGKIAVPTSIMNKKYRLEGRLSAIRLRFELFAARYRIQFLEKRITGEEYEKICGHLQKVISLVEEINTAGFLTEEKRKEISAVLEDAYEDGEEKIPYFTEEEKEDLLIEKGTLTEKERRIMEGHVEITERILSKVHFNQNFEDSRRWAVLHHEYLDGTGYPRHLTAEELPLEARMLTVADICDALLATDRPYKKTMPKAKAFAIMYDMVKQGKLDEKVVGYLENCIE